MQAAPALTPSVFECDRYTLPLSAHHPAALRELANQYIAFLNDDLPNESLSEICFTLGARRSYFPHRLACTGDSAATLRSNLQAFIDERPSTGLLQGTVKNPRRDPSRAAAASVD